MPIVNRTRSRNVNRAGGSAIWYGPGSLGPITKNYQMQEYCSDTIGNRKGENSFYHYRRSGINWTCGGWTSSTPGNRWRYNGLINSGYPSENGALTSAPTDYASLEMGRARTNPNRPITDLPVFLFELKDIPRLIKQAGDLIRYAMSATRNGRKALHEMPWRSADAYLGYEFGLAPLMRDLQNMLNFQGSVDKKLSDLNELYSGGGHALTKHATVWSDVSYSSYGNYYLSGLYAETNVWQFRTATTRKKWVSVKWKPNSPPPKTVDDRRWLATRLAYGLDLNFSTIWEAMPWSWLVDWFTTVGDHLQNTRNTVPVTMTGSCVMLSSETRWLSGHRVGGSGGFPIASGDSYVIHRRTPGSLISGSSLLKADLPFLDGKQLSILSALITSRLGRRS